MGATRLSCMIMFILAGAEFLSMTMGYTGIPRAPRRMGRDRSACRRSR